MFLRWIGFAPKATSSEQCHAPALPFPIRFAFERQIVLMPGRPPFRPLQDAVHRWCGLIKRAYSATGPAVNALYERPDGSFVVVVCEDLRQSTVGSEQIWQNAARPTAKEVTPKQALAFYLQNQDDAPASPRMRQLIAEYEADPQGYFQPVDPAAGREPRPLDHWAGKGYAWLPSRRFAHETTPLRAMHDIVWSVTAALNALRGLPDSTTLSGREFRFEALFRRHPVHAGRWKPEGDEPFPDWLLPEEIDESLERTDIPQKVRDLRSLVETPVTILAAAAFCDVPDEDVPTEEEIELAKEELRSKVDAIARLSVSIRDEAADAFCQYFDEADLTPTVHPDDDFVSSEPEDAEAEAAISENLEAEEELKPFQDSPPDRSRDEQVVDEAVPTEVELRSVKAALIELLVEVARSSELTSAKVDPQVGDLPATSGIPGGGESSAEHPPSDRPKEAAVAEPVDVEPTANKDAVGAGTPTALTKEDPEGAVAATSLSPAQASALRAYASAIQEIGDATYQDIYAWLQDHADDIGYRLPTFDAFTRNVRRGRDAAGLPSRRALSGVATRSVVPVQKLK